MNQFIGPPRSLIEAIKDGIDDGFEHHADFYHHPEYAIHKHVAEYWRKELGSFIVDHPELAEELIALLERCVAMTMGPNQNGISSSSMSDRI